MKKHIVFALLVVSLFFSGNLWAGDDSNRIRVDGDRLSVRAEGMALGNLLSAVEDMTGVRFSFDESVTEKKVYVDFEGLPLTKGLKKIIHPLNFATIYDDTGKLSKVIILGRWKGSPPIAPQKEENVFPKGLKPAPSDLLSLTPEGGSDNSAPPKITPSGKGPTGSSGPPVDKPYAMDKPPDRKDQVMEGPPVWRVRSMNRQSDTEGQKSEGPPEGGSPDHSPPPDPDDSPTDGPPQDWKYEVDGPPSWQHM